MPKAPLFHHLETPRGWMVSIPAALSAAGKRERRFFKTEGAAKTFAKGLRSTYLKGHRGGLIAPELAMDAARAAEILQPLGMTLTEAAREMVARAARRTGPPETFAERYGRVLVANEEEWSDRYMRDMESLCRYLPAWFHERQCSLIDTDTIRRAVEEGGARALSTIAARSRYVSAVLNYQPTHRKASEIQIMTHAQCAAMLRACETPDQRRAVALLLFAGIRPSAEDGEIARLNWSAVGAAEIYISRQVSKTPADRHIPITPRLRRLLAGHPESGPVAPAGWRRTYQRLRKAAELGMAQDVTRHTFASHFLAAYGEAETKQAMGHSAGSQTLFRHYRRAVTTAAGKRFFGVVASPEGHR